MRERSTPPPWVRTASSAWRRPDNVTSLAFLVDQLTSPVPGGMGTYVRRLVPALSRADPSLDIALFHARSGPAEGPPAIDASPEPWLREYWVEELPHSIRRLYPSWAVARRPPLPASLSA